MSIPDSGTRLAVRNVDELVELVPYLLGFHPDESLVVIVLDDGRVVVTARVDLAAVRDAAALDHLLGRLFGRYPAAEGWFLAYTDDDDLAWDVLADCVGIVGLARLGRLLQVGQHEWRADRPDGESGLRGGEVSAAAAQAALLGLSPRPSRRDLAAGLAGPPDAETGGLLAAFEATAAELDAMGERGRRRLLQRLLRAATPLRREECIRLALLAGYPDAQLAALWAVDAGNAERHLRTWTQVVRHCLTPYRPAVLGLLGVAAWQTGDGALQVVCLEEVDRIDPAFPLATLLEYLNGEMVPPQEWRLLRPFLLGSLEAQFRPAGPRATRRRR